MPASHDAVRCRAGVGIFALCVITAAWGGPQGHGETFHFNALGITVPDGFTVERAAGQPLVDRPVSLAFDEEGHLYVADSSGSNAPLAEQQADPRHRIVRLTDHDGDGFFDTATLFADRLMMLQGTLWHRGALYAAAGAQIWKFTDRDADGVADEREVWFDGKTLTNCGNDMHGPYLGRDGWFYWCKGGFAEQSHDLPGRPGWKTRAAHVFRARPDRPGAEIEVVMTGGMDNPVDVAFTEAGERLVSATFLEHPAGGKRDGVIHALYGGVYGKEHGVLDGHPRTGRLLPALTQMGPAAACGIHIHSGQGFGTDYAGDLFACSFNLQTVSRHHLVPAGGTFTSLDEPFLKADAADFHPTDVIEDADGSLLVVDTGGWYKLCCPTSQLEKPAVLGAIYRVRRRGVPVVVDPRGRQIDWRRMNAEDRVSMLADERPAVTATVIDAVRQSGTAAVEPLRRMIATSTAAVSARRNAIWALAGIEGEDAGEAVRLGLTDAAVEVRQAAAHVAGLKRDAGAAGLLAALLADADAACIRAAAEALGRIGSEAATEAVLAACPQAPGRAIEHSLTFALIESGQPEMLVAALDAADPRVRQAALIALDQGGAGHGSSRSLRDHVLAACRDDDPGLRDAGWWIASGHPDWAEALADQVTTELERTSARPGEHQRIIALVARLSTNPRVADAVAAACRGGAPAVQAMACETMRSARPSQVPDSWVDGLVALMRDESPAAANNAVETLAGLALSPEQRSRVRATLLAMAAEPTAPPKICLLLMQVAGTADPPPRAVVERLIVILIADAADAGTSPLDRSAAAAALRSGRLTDDQLARIAPALTRLPAHDVTELLPLFTSRAGDPLVTALTAVSRHRDPSAISRDAVAAAVAALPTDQAAMGRELLDRIDAARAGQREAYERLATSLPQGNPARGHAVFFSNKAACSGCHAMAYVGGRIGPDLSTIGKIRTSRDLLEAIVIPSASFVRSYEPVTVLTLDGRVFSGIIREETAADILLQTNATTTERISRASIESIEAGTVSLMPKGYDMILSPQELADLVAFLTQAK